MSEVDEKKPVKKKRNRFDLHDERLGTTDEKGHRVFLHPEDVKGIWRTRRTQVYWFLIFLYLVLPWIKIGGKQPILLNIPGREFTFFGTTFYGHDAPIFIFVLLGFTFSMGFITSIWGRVWCGWGCPQTVFIDAIYRKIETFVEGSARQRIKLDEAPMSLSKLTKRVVKWLLYTIVSVHIAHSFLAYFVGGQELFWITTQAPAENMTLFIFMVCISALFLFDFGFFREQFCIIACPYGRIQSVIMDENSSYIAYDAKRGEPRRGPGVPKDEQGDCINCFHCVMACPTGIDIRRGNQLECIACTQCIDACDDIMDRLKKPHGLIRFDSFNGIEGKEVKKFGLRSGIYLIVMTVLFSGFVFSLNKRGDVDLRFVRGNQTPFSKVKDKGAELIQNFYKANIAYPNHSGNKVGLRVADPELAKTVQVRGQARPMKKDYMTLNIFFRFPQKLLKSGNLKLPLELIETDKKGNVTVLTKSEVNLVGPFN